MLISWWWIWLLFMFVFLVPPLGYGWGYRRWGTPYPRYIQRRRAGRAAMDGSADTQFNHHAWGWGGDFIWVVVIIGMIWLVTAAWWR
jgi:hypothetical protein